MTPGDPNRATLLQTLGLGFLAGVGLWWLTNAASNSTLGGPGWTLQGNGALIVLFAGGAALLAFGWLALGQWALRRRNWLPRAALGTLAVLVLEVAFGALPIMLGDPNAIAPLVAACLVLGLAAGVALASGGLLSGGILAAVLLALSLAPLGVQFFVLPVFLPLVVALPSLSVARSRWLVACGIGVPLAVLCGASLPQALIAR